jgi:hypothetical protein
MPDALVGGTASIEVECSNDSTGSYSRRRSVSADMRLLTRCESLQARIFEKLKASHHRSVSLSKWGSESRSDRVFRKE